MKITVNGGEEMAKKFRALADRDARLPLYVLGKIAGMVNIKLAVPGIFDGKLPGFQRRTGQAQAEGTGLTMKVNGKGFSASLSSPYWNLFEGFRRRPRVALIASLKADFMASSIAEDETEKAYKLMISDQLGDLDRFARVARKRKSRRTP